MASIKASTMVEPPKTQKINIITPPAMPQEIRPFKPAKPTTAITIIAMVLAKAPVRNFKTKFAEFSTGDKEVVVWASAPSVNMEVAIMAKQNSSIIFVAWIIVRDIFIFSSFFK